MATKNTKKTNIIKSTEAHVEAEAHVVTLAEVEEDIRLTNIMEAHNTKKRAEAFYRIYTLKLYETLKNEEGVPCNNFKSYVKEYRGGEVYGVKYAMAMHYVNLCKYVYPQREDFVRYGVNILIPLIKYLKSEEDRGVILEAVDNGTINADLSTSALKDILEDMFGGKEGEAEVKAEAEVPEEEVESKYALSEEAIDNALEVLWQFIENNAHDTEVNDAFLLISKALDR